MFSTRSLIVLAAIAASPAALAQGDRPPSPDPAPAQAAARPATSEPAPRAPKHEWAVSDSKVPSYDTGTLTRLNAAIERYSVIVAKGGWPLVPTTLTPETKGAEVGALVQRLATEGYLSGDAIGSSGIEAQVEAALKAFQVNAGLNPTGRPNRATIVALNVSAADRLRALKATARRLSAFSFPFGPRHIVVNIPSASLEAVEDGQVARRYTVVVGDTRHRSPEIAARVQSINLNPTWTLPASIVRTEIIPQMRKDPGYLAAHRIRILDGKGGEIDPASLDWSGDKAAAYLYRQDPGVQNALGAIRINMPNTNAVYMHDTPSKRAFSAMDRFLSHGCVRVEGVWDLAAWLLDGNSPDRQDRMGLVAMASDGVSRELKLTRSVPVIWVYMTAWADTQGSVHYRPDVYKYDLYDPEAVSAILKGPEGRDDRAPGP
jgi:murein L,D-transpeptidase YcbB/YkuD